MCLCTLHTDPLCGSSLFLQLAGDLDEHGIMGPDGSSAGDGADWGEEIRFRALTLEQPPFEEHLLQSTLWPEIQKLYGHPDDIVCVAASHNGRFVAASCRVSSNPILLSDVFSTVVCFASLVCLLLCSCSFSLP